MPSILKIAILTIFYLQATLSRHVTKKHHLRKNKMELSALANKMFHQHSVRRNIQCPVCSQRELATCDWKVLESSSCQLPEFQSDCDCCPKCLSKEGEMCGSIEDPLRPGYSGSIQGCEKGFECTTYVGQGTCQKIEGLDLPEMDYLDDYYNYDDDLTNSVENGDYIHSLPLEKGCNNHAATLSSLSFFYPAALGLPLWSPECQPSNSKLYQLVQCRMKETTKEHVCWCVDQDSGVPTIHHHWDPKEINEKLCAELNMK